MLKNENHPLRGVDQSGKNGTSAELPKVPLGGKKVGKRNKRGTPCEGQGYPFFPFRCGTIFSELKGV